MKKHKRKKFYATLLEAADATKALNIKTCSEYGKRYIEDPLLPSTPSAFYREDWVSWPAFFGRAKNFYASILEASEAALLLGITSKPKYKKLYSKDPRLPSDPDRIYVAEWEGWPFFLGQTSRVRDIYPTLNEAVRSAQNLGITSSTEYFKRYLEDPRLPSTPNITYAREWISWPSFFGTGKVYYASLEKASNASVALGISTSGEYFKRYSEDPRLPSNPSKTYAKEWKRWPVFLKKFDRIRDLYPTLQQAAESAQNLGIKNSTEYRNRYSEDPRLPFRPNSNYAEEWVSWPLFLGKTDCSKNFYSTIEEASDNAKLLGITKCLNIRNVIMKMLG